jgi:hypothetical protein
MGEWIISASHTGDGTDRRADGDPSFHTVGRRGLDILLEHIGVRAMYGDTEMLVSQPGASQVLHGCFSDGPVLEDRTQLWFVGLVAPRFTHVFNFASTTGVVSCRVGDEGRSTSRRWRRGGRQALQR